MAGYWNRSRQQELDVNDNLIIGARAYFYEGSSPTTAMTTYSSATLGEINEHPHPVVTDGSGRWPQVFFDDATFSFYDVRVTDAAGVQLYYDQGVPIIGQVVGEGGGEPVPVDQTALAKTGDVKMKLVLHDDFADAGWVRCNGLTISKDGGGGTERDDDDTQALFVHLWSKFNNAICPLAGGAARTTALNDFNTGQQITLPDMRGRAPFGVGTMGNSAAARIATAYVDTPAPDNTGNVVGTWGGDDDIVLAANNLAAHQHPGAGGNDGATPPVAAPLVATAHTHLMVDLGAPVSTTDDPLTAALPIAQRSFTPGDEGQNTWLAAGTTAGVGKTGPAVTVPPAPAPPSPLAGTLTISGNTGSNVTTSAGHENMPPFMLIQFQIKL